tara:strand:- start:1291 stop:1734 length:444 start_codon:yes stop_codon:yes gene_type:complete
MLKIFFFFILLIDFTASFAKEEYFLTLRNDKVNLRQGPSFEYPIKIFYKKKFLPVLIQEESDNFRKVRDHQNNSGWIHISQLSKKRAAITIVENVIIFKKPTVFSKPQAKLKKGRLLLISKCDENWCKVRTENIKGWVSNKDLWGRF